MKKFIKIFSLVLVCLLVVFAVSHLDRSQTDNSQETQPPGPNDQYTVDGELWDIVDTSKAEYSYSEMVDDLEQLADKGEGKFTYRAVGESLDGRKIYAAVLGNPSAEKQIIVSAGIHAREYMTPMLVMKQLEYYLYNYDTGAYGGMTFAEMFDKYVFCVLPMCNPDGITLVQSGIDGLRSEELRQGVLDIYEHDKKTTSDFASLTLSEYLQYWKTNAAGVDLNRNFDTPAWENNKVKVPCAIEYRGEEPLSEPETKAMADYVSTLSNPVCSLAVHSRGEIIYFNCGQPDNSAELALAQLVKGVTGYSIKYESRGVAAFDDWCILKKNIPSVTVETGISVCPLPIEEFEKIWNDNRDLWAAVASSGKY